MKLDRRLFVVLVAGALSLCVGEAFAGVRPLPPGARPPVGYGWCPRCEGRRYVPSGFLGWSSKPCPDCRATGLVRLPPPPPPPPVVKPHHHHHPGPHHAAPSPARPPHNPAPQPQPGPRPAPRPGNPPPRR